MLLLTVSTSLKEEALEYKKKLNNVSKEVENIVSVKSFEDEIKEVQEIEKKIKKEQKKEVVKFKKKKLDEDKIDV